MITLISFNAGCCSKYDIIIGKKKAKKKREVHQFYLMASRLHIVSTVVHTICQTYFGGLSIRIGSGETVRISTFVD